MKSSSADKQTKSSSSNSRSRRQPQRSGLQPKSFEALLYECLSNLHLGIKTRDALYINRVFRRIPALRHQLFKSDFFIETVKLLVLPKSEARALMLIEYLENVKPVNKLTLKCCSAPPSSVSVSVSAAAAAAADVSDSQGGMKAVVGCQQRPSSPTEAAAAAPIAADEDVEMKSLDDSQTVETGEVQTAAAAQSPGSKYLKLLTYSKEDYRVVCNDFDLFLSTLGLTVLIDNKLVDSAVALAVSIVESLSQYPLKQKYEGLIMTKAIFYCYRAYEMAGENSTLSKMLMDFYRSCAVHRQLSTQTVTLILLVRNFIQQKLYDQAIKLLEKTSYPESLRSGPLHIRYLYYLARISAVRLDYGDAFSKIMLVIRKGPQESAAQTGKGFRLASHKLCVVIQLLMGEIPDRQLFNLSDLKKGLIPYAKIVKAVRSGDLLSFKRILAEENSTFTKDENVDFIHRLDHNVVRIGLKKICTSYSAISLSDVAVKLGLDSGDDVECIVSKAITDGVISASINVEEKTVYSKAQGEKRAFDDLRKVIHSRIAFCLQFHNETLKAMKYSETRAEDSKIEEAAARRKEHQEHLVRAEKDEYENADEGDF